MDIKSQVERCENSLVLNEIDRALKDWKICFWIWLIIHYTLGVSSTAIAVIITSKIFENFNTELSVYVAVSTAILTFLKAQAKSATYIVAWRVLRGKRMAYYAGTASLQDLVDCYAQQEVEMGKHD